jgi:protein gp37
MGSSSKIEWTDATWSPIRARVRPDAIEIARRKGYDSLVKILTAIKPDGSPRIVPGQSVGPHCERVSPGCGGPDGGGCYSEANNHRCLPHNGTGLPFDRRSRDLVEIFIDEKILMEPLGWQRPRLIFVCSQTDLYGEFVPDVMIDRVKAMEAQCPRHFFLELTKRSGRMMEYNATMPPEWPLPHVGLGVSCENQPVADVRIAHLLRTEAALRFVSYEPALELVDFWHILNWGRRIGWLIAGGESGLKARPSYPAWFRNARDQCQAASVPFLFKQWGEWGPIGGVPFPYNGNCKEYAFNDERGRFAMARVGKKSAGRLLDGRIHDEFPRLIVEHLGRAPRGATWPANDGAKHDGREDAV